VGVSNDGALGFGQIFEAVVSMSIGVFAELLTSGHGVKHSRHFRRKLQHCCRRHEVARHATSSDIFADANCVAFHVVSGRVLHSNLYLRSRSGLNVLMYVAERRY